MLDAKTDGKRLGLHGHAALVQHGKCVARAVAQRHHHVVGTQLGGLARGLVQHLQAAQVAGFTGAFDDHVRHALLKADLAAQRNDLLAQVFDHLHQLEGADVRVGDVQNLFGRTGFDELVHHFAAQVARVLDLAV